MPVFPLALGITELLFGDSLRAVGAMNATFVILAGFFVRRVVRSASAPLVADAAAALTITYPPLLSSTALVLQEAFLAFLVALLFLVTHEALVRPGPLRSFLAGAALGAATLGKPTVMGAAPLIALLVCARAPGRLKRGIPFVLGAVLILAPWVARNWSVLGRFEISPGNGGHTMLGGTVSNRIDEWFSFPEYQAAVKAWREGESRDQPVLDRYLARVAVRRILADPMHWFLLCGERLGRFMLPARVWFVQVGLSEGGTFTPIYVLATALNVSLFAFSLKATIRAVRLRDRTMALGPVLIFSHMLVYGVTYVSPRYALTVTPVLIATAVLEVGRARTGRERSASSSTSCMPKGCS